MVLTLLGPVQAFRMMKTPLHHFRQNWWTIENIPQSVFTLATGIAGLAYLYRAGLGPEIVWTRKNPEPYNTIDQDETPKWGMKLGPRKDAIGLPQRVYGRRWTRIKSIAKEKEGKIINFETIMNRPENRGGSESRIVL
ncbi:hypothetical protein M422DRAFT_260158 [Sphaerobolus stellatus SS14]|uniref:Uncharacterized protein n=1 Tax=Sphaerobolus stellatus (strain SS14) TaxID=990650 RepID=A0A0C9U3Q3_SPHS4|nr:hypothetical protein M422DRAFT_260158 [Sphaerobolus stellatus SS14]